MGSNPTIGFKKFRPLGILAVSCSARRWIWILTGKFVVPVWLDVIYGRSRERVKG
ncbi:hypothetical protein QUB68_11245 [Microcoleus sp. A006_D1]|uniref:hypothetical protein n=1 Tax=Microcoleus sp. A006_D1 TaxID=3055267 RepID=UPI002FD5732D